MGTRHVQVVITKKGETKISQYGQWDGYPSGQGIDILNFLKNGNLRRYQENLEKIKPITKKQIKFVEQLEDWNKVYYFLSRDCGARIHTMIEWGAVPFVYIMSKKEADQNCAWFYTIDFSKNEFVSEKYKFKQTYKLDALPTNEEYLKIMEPEEE